MDHRLLKQALENGCSYRLAEMLACKRPPGAVTDEIRGVGTADPFDSVPEEMRGYYRQRALAAGVDPTGKKYYGSLADSPGDPKALVENKSDIRRVLRHRGDGCEDLGVKPAPLEEDFSPVGAPAEDIVEEVAMDSLARDGCDGTCTVQEWNDAKDSAASMLKRD